MKIKDLIESVARELVDDRELVRIKEIKGDRLTVYELKVAKGDVGKVIGKGGQTAKAMRTLVNAIGTKQNKRVLLEIVE